MLEMRTELYRRTLYLKRPLQKDTRKEDKYQDAGLVEKYKIKKLLSPIKCFISPMNRISSQKRCFVFVRGNNT